MDGLGVEERADLVAGLTAAGFRIHLPAAGYFIVADAAPLGFPDARELCLRLPELVGVVGVPLSAFCHAPLAAEHASLVRFAFCKRIDVLEEAARRLGALATGTA